MSLKIDDLILRLMEPVPPLPLIWEALTNIWKSDGPPPNVDDYFFENERLTNRLEKAVHECFFEVYDQLAEQAQEARAENLFGEEEAALIIMDGLSIREAGLFSPMITDAGFEVISRGYSFSCVPSVTAPFSQRFFGAATPSSIRRSKEFHYVYIESGRVPQHLPLQGKMVIWISYPDQLMHHAGTIIRPSEAFAKTRETLFTVLGRLERETATITSDHGYIYAQSIIEHCWPPPRRDEQLLRGIFGAKRAVPIVDISPTDRRKLKQPPDRRYVSFVEDQCCVIGRYYWSTAGRSSDVGHGGISLTECLVPVLKIRRLG